METTIKGQFIVENYALRSFVDREVELFEAIKRQYSLGTIVEISIAIKNTGKSMPKCQALGRYGGKCDQLLNYETGVCPNADYHKVEEDDN